MEKIEFKHPVTEKVYNTREELIDVLAKDWNKFLKWKYELEQEEIALIKTINDLCGEPDKTKGVVRALGAEFELKLTRRENSKYEKERGEEHPLLTLSKTFARVKEFFSLDVRERTGEVDNFIKNVEAGVLNASEDKMLLKKLVAIRSKTSGKPEIEVKVRKVENE